MTEVIDTTRGIQRVLKGQETVDGSGVRLSRLIGSAQLPQLDPFLLLDYFRSDDPNEDVGGFPPHPHRGFETVTYLLSGQVVHRDNAGHSGTLQAGGVQWMTAGKGIVHSEMLQQQNGQLAGFQLWVNLPSKYKMTASRYQEFKQEALPLEQREEGIEIRVVAGKTSQNTQGPVRQLMTPALFFDITIPNKKTFNERLNALFHGFIYVIEGAVSVKDVLLETDTLAILGEGEQVEVTACEPSRFLLVAGLPLREPIARQGPFVMNTKSELKQAFQDYQEGRF
jgi:redox-sensitive bicupin YhaK (pirin superfamily)